MENKDFRSQVRNIFARLKNWSEKRQEYNPLKDAHEMASAFEQDLRERLEKIVGERDSQYVTFQIHAGYIEQTKASELSVRVFMKPDKINDPTGVALQIHNAFWGTENDKQFKGKFNVRTLGKNTIKMFKDTSGQINLIDKQWLIG